MVQGMGRRKERNMKFKKTVSKLLACVLVATSVFIGNAADADAATTRAEAAEGFEGERDPIAKITADCYDKNITLEPTKTAAVFRLPSTLKPGRDVTVTYDSSNENIAKVDGNGLVTAQKKVGYARITTTVTALYDGFEMEYQTIVKVNHDIAKVNVSADKASIAKGGTATVKITPTAAMNNAGWTVTYTATNGAAVANNKATAKVTAKKSGTVIVTANISSAGKSIKKRITINVGEITGKSSVKAKKSITLSVKGLDGKVTWSLDKKGKKLASISKSGKLTAKKKGNVKVTAKVKVGKGTVTLTKSVKIK